MDSKEAQKILADISERLGQLSELMKSWDALSQLRAPRRNKQYRGQERVSHPNNRAVGASVRELLKRILSAMPEAPPAPRRTMDDSVNKAVSPLITRIWDRVPVAPYALIPEEHEDSTYIVGLESEESYATFDKTIDTTSDYVALAASEIWLKAVMTRLDSKHTELQSWAWEQNIPEEAIRLYILSRMPKEWVQNPQELRDQAEAAARDAIDTAWDWYKAGISRDAPLRREALGYDWFKQTPEGKAKYDDMIRRMINDEG